MIAGLQALGKTIFLTTHYMEEADVLADRICVLAAAKIVAEGTPKTLGGREHAQTEISFTMPAGVRQADLPTALGDIGRVENCAPTSRWRSSAHSRRGRRSASTSLATSKCIGQRSKRFTCGSGRDPHGGHQRTPGAASTDPPPPKSCIRFATGCRCCETARRASSPLPCRSCSW